MAQGLLKSCLCTEAQLRSEAFGQWMDRLRHPLLLDRKLWEWCYVPQALHERGMLGPGKRGLGFAVGREPLPALFANLGCEIVATDQPLEQAQRDGWTTTKQHAAGLEALLRPELCEPETFFRQVSFRVVDMNAIPADLRGFDFVWSSCSFEHLGSIERGLQFLENMMECLRPGGVAVHTTEHNVSSNFWTLKKGGCVLFRRRDIEKVARRLRKAGHHIELDFDPGSGPADGVVDKPPYGNYPHLKLDIGGYVSTSLGLIITKKAR